MFEVSCLKKFSVCILAISILSLLLAQNFNNAVPVNTAFENVYKYKIIIDAGHGGFDGGAVALDGTLEKDINLKISKKLEKFCGFGGMSVIMTRNDDSGIENDSSKSISQRKISDMKNRLSIINENNDGIYVSIHLNKFEASSAKGSQVFYSKNNERSEPLAKNVQDSIVTRMQPGNNRLTKKADNSIYLLKNSKIPSIIVECGFLSNQEELQLLKSSDYQTKLAFSIYCGILDYLNTGE